MPTGTAVATRDSLVRQAFLCNSDNLGARVLSGASFQFLGIALRTLITLGSTAILARLLSPADFGYVAMATVVTEFAALLSNFGLTNVLIQRRVINRLQLDTVFWASAILGALLAGLVFLASFFASWLFGDARIDNLLRVMSLTFVFSGLTSVSSTVLARLLRFRTEFWIQMTWMAVRTLTAIAFALMGFGVWSLVAGALAGAASNAVMSFVAVPYLPRLRFSSAYLASIWKTSGSYLGSGLLYYVSMNLDLVLIGRHLGVTSLGYYQNARSLTDEIRARIAMPLQHVLFPAFSAMQADPPRLRELVLRSGRTLAAIVVPIGVGVSANAAELVLLLYGEKWRAMTPVIAMFGLSAALRAATATSTPLFNASNRVGLAFRYNLFGTILMVGGIALALPYGVEGVALAMAVSSLYSLVTFRVGLGLTGLGTRHMLQILGPPALASLAMWAAVAAGRPFVGQWSTYPGLVLPVQVVAGALIYLTALHLISRQYLQDFRELALKFLKKP